MRILCDSCGTKYSISDDKVRGKVFKIRCKNCSHVIIVRGDNEAEAAVAAGAAGGGAVWYIVRNGQQDGPYDVSDIERFIADGEANADTYTWKEGFSDWVPMSSVDDLKHILPSANVDATVALGMGGMSAAMGGHHHHEEPHIDPSPSLDAMDDGEATRVVDADSFKRQLEQKAAMDAAAAAPAPAPEPEPAFTPSFAPATMPDPEPAPSFAPAAVAAAAAPIPSFGGDPSPAPSASDDGGLAGLAALGSSPAAAPAAVNIRNASPKADMVGGRNEDSVLFSLNSLSSVTSSSAQDEAPKNTEASGLIDIMALSASAAAVSAGREQGGPSPMGGADPFAGGGPAIAVPAMMPMGTRKSNTGLFVAIGAGVFVIFLLVAAVVVALLLKDDTPKQVVMNEPPGQTGSAQAGAGAGEAQEGSGEAKDAPKDEPKDEEKADKGEDDKGDSEDPAEKDDEAAEKDEDDKGEKEDEAAKAARLAKAEADAKKTPAQLREEREEREKRLAELREKREQEKAAAAASKNDKGGKGGKGGDAIDDILGGITGGNAPAKKDPPKEVADKTPPPSEPAGGKSLSKGDVQRVIRGAYGQVSACNANQADKKSGTVTVRFTIQPSGAVGGAQVTGGFAGTPVGGCIARVVRGLRFPSFSGSPVTITFPFVLK